jgi:hypothetical protein
MIVSVQYPRQVFDKVGEAGNDQGTVGEAAYSWQTFEESARQKFAFGVGGESRTGSASVTLAAHEGLLQGKAALSGCCTAPEKRRRYR